MIPQKKTEGARGKILPHPTRCSAMSNHTEDRLTWVDWVRLALAVGGVALALWGVLISATT